MSRLKLKLTRNLRRSVLRGHPWVYRDAIAPAPDLEVAQLAHVSDAKGEFVAWAMYDPHGPLALRVLSLDSAPPTAATYAARFARALDLRRSVRSSETNAYRLFAGEGDGLPGLVCDVYDRAAVVQFDGRGPSEFWPKAEIAEWLLKHAGVSTVVEKARRKSGDAALTLLAGDVCDPCPIVRENGALFRVNLEKGQKTGFFLDQRPNRDFVRSRAGGKSVLNLFSYTGGFSVYAGLGAASRVASVDVAQGAIDLACENWELNGLAPGHHSGICADVFEFIATDRERWDHVIVDPPSMGHSEEGKAQAIAKYVSLFAAAAKKVKPGGELSLSSCSSHVSFGDFLELIEEALSQARLRGQVLRVSGQGEDHPFPHVCQELRYLKFVHLALW